jgi:hypothetical protein
MASRRIHPYAGARVPVVLPVLADSVYPISSFDPVNTSNKAGRGFISLANHLTLGPALGSLCVCTVSDVGSGGGTTVIETL